MKNLKIFWFEFEVVDRFKSLGIDLGCGVTAYNYNDAIFLLKECVFKDKSIFDIKKVTEDIDISTLDAGHVLPNMYTPSFRGVWYPMGYQILDYK